MPFFKTYVEGLSVEKVSRFNLYIQQAGKTRLFRGRNFPITQEDIDSLVQRGLKYVLLELESKKNFLTYIENNLDRIVSSDAIPDKEKSAIVKEVTENFVTEFFDDPSSEKAPERVKFLCDCVIKLIFDSGDTLQYLVEDMSIKYNFSLHASRVCYFTVSLAKAVNINQNDVQALSQASILHDLGKMKIPSEVREKMGTFGDTDWSVMKLHPKYSIEILNQSLMRDRRLLIDNAILLHHERMDGSGYPKHLKAKKIGKCERILALTNSFDSLTTEKVYRPAMTAFNALQYMLQSQQYDNDLLRVFIPLLSQMWKIR